MDSLSPKQPQNNRMADLRSTIRRYLGVREAGSSHSEKLISGLGGFLAILVILLISHRFLALPDALAVVASMGASAVLLFAVPHGPLSQPWPLIGGNLISAFIGVSCAHLIDPPILAASVAVGASITAMYYLKCIHPPGGATALTAVIGGESIHALGYEFLLTPVLLNVFSILAIAVLFNAFFHWRRYPAYWHQQQTEPQPASQDGFSHSDFLNALKEIDSFVDINEYDLRRILALIGHPNTQLSSSDIELGRVYSNGLIGRDWSMRRIIDESGSDDPEKDFVIFKQIAGQERKTTDCVTREEFAHWAKYEMVQENGLWHRKTSSEPHPESRNG
jgi:CBS-domain-containing membrane protein